MMLWLIVALLTGLVTAALVPSLTGRARPAPGRRAAALAVYRAQLTELDRDRERGILGEAEAAALKAEIERRMLKAAGGPEEQDRHWRARPAGVIAAMVLVPVAALALYLALGHPGLPGKPRPNLGALPVDDSQTMEMAGLVQELEQRMVDRPQDPVGWRLLARSQGSLGRWADSAASYARAVAAGAGDAETLAAWAESVIFAAGGAVSPPAEEILRRTLIADPSQPRARYYQGLAQLQAGRVGQALATWRALSDETAPNAPWARFLQERIRLAEAMAGPGTAEVTALEELSPEERDAAVRGMVQRLANRLEREPEDLDGWLKLAHARGVLGQLEERRRALERAAALAPGRADIELELAATEAELGAEEEAKARLEALLKRLPPDASERPEAEAQLNRLRDRE
ncbi:MAG TPA: c-type cytochrome biogenesis protein CcmI [Alphaproteobacteria bacterium]|nr:c-type cytochrome biogenesis protein CcmI [Alphaproteobacteria bacterium]